MKDRSRMQPEHAHFPQESWEARCERIATERDDALAKVQQMAEILIDVSIGRISRDEILNAALIDWHTKGTEGARWPKPEKDSTSLVYYIRMGDRIKIGRSTSIVARMQSFYAQEEQLLAVEPGGADVEKIRHAEFAHLRVGKTELFISSPDLEDHVQAVRKSRDLPPMSEAIKINQLAGWQKLAA